VYLPDVVEIEERYANAVVNIIPTVIAETTLPELPEDDYQDNVIAVEVNA
jgi:hypothetical protein